MPSFSLSLLLSSDKVTWVVTGLGALLAVYTTYWQLDNFRKRTIIRPSGTKSVGVEQSTEDAIRLDTLSVLACGVNSELRTAALKILCERALKDEAFGEILEKIEADDLARNFVGLRVLALLLQNASPRRLVQPRVFKALLDTLRRASKTVDPPHPYTMRCQREAISLLIRLIPLGDIAHKYAIDAGLIDWIKESQVSGYDPPSAAAFDTNRIEPIDQHMYALLSALCGRSPSARDSLVELGLLRNSRVAMSPTGRMYEPGEGLMEVVPFPDPMADGHPLDVWTAAMTD